MKRLLLKKNLLWVPAIALVSAFILWPLLRHGFYLSDDGEWMVIRLSAFFQSLKDGQFPTRFLGRLNYQYGYPVSNFLYPGFLYLGTVIHIVGFSFTDTIKVLLGLSVIGSGVFVFQTLRKEFNGCASFFGATSFLLAPYLSFDLYVRGSVGEILALLPASMSLYSIAATNYWLFPLSVAFLVISHNSVAFLFLLFLLLYIVVKKAWNFFLPLGIGIALSMFFWFPALYEKKYVLFDVIQIADPSRYFLDGPQLLLLGFVGVIAAFIVLRTKNKRKSNGLLYLFLTVFFLSIFMTTALSNSVWRITSLGSIIQFPYRFLVLTMFAGSWLVALAVRNIKKETVIWFIILSVVIWFFSLFPILGNIKYVSRPMGFYTTNEATTTVHDEYMPRWVKIKPTSHAGSKIIFYKGGGQLRPTEVTTQRMDIEVVAKGEAIVQFNTVYYPGWGVTVDGEPVVIDYKNPEGVMRVTIPDGKHTVKAEFHETISRFIADSVSFLSILFYLVYVLLLHKKRL